MKIYQAVSYTHLDVYKRQVKKIYDEGNEIASNSEQHQHVNNLSYEQNIEEMEKSNDKIEKITGTRTKIYRAPYGCLLYTSRCV